MICRKEIFSKYAMILSTTTPVASLTIFSSIATCHSNAIYSILHVLLCLSCLAKMIEAFNGIFTHQLEPFAVLFSLIRGLSIFVLIFLPVFKYIYSISF